MRAAIETAVANLTPAVHTDVGFRAALDETDFREWAEDSVDGVARRFTVLRRGDRFLGCSNGDVELHVTDAELLVAYPTAGGWWGSHNLRALDDTIDADARQIDRAVGHDGGASYAAGVHMVMVARDDVERLPGVWVLPLRLEVTYDEDSA